MKHGLQIFASAMFFAVIVFMVWYKGADAGIIKQSLCILGIKGKKERPMKHGLQIFASAMFFAVIVFMVWYTICGMQGAEEGPEGTLVFHEDGKLVEL